jgi:hypothetical protein
MKGFDQSVSISLAADIAWVPLVQSVVEKGAPVYGLDESRAMMLAVAVEEIVVHLARMAPGTQVCFRLEPGGWHVRVDFSFKADPSDLWAMNLVTTTDTQEEIDHLGLLVASRAVDGFTITTEGDTLNLSLRKDRDYPVVTPEAIQPVKTRGPLTIVRDPEPELIKAACVKALGRYPADAVPRSFFTPGKVVDMVGQRDMAVAVAVDRAETLAGMICWQAPSEQGISFFGPYVFAGDDQAGDFLTSHLINTVARTRAMGLFSELATTSLAASDFESLGCLDLAGKDGRTFAQDVWYRHLREDMGASVWAHRSFAEFLETAYKRQILMRDLKIIEGQGERLPDRSVFSVELRPDIGQATLFPMVTGADAFECIARHVEMLAREKFPNIFIRIDLAHGWQAAMGGAIADNGFVPKLVLPYGGKSDVLVFQHA